MRLIYLFFQLTLFSVDMWDLELLSVALDLLRDGMVIALCTIIGKEGSAPRSVGSKMIVCEDGRVYGTIGGGDFERLLVREALKAIRMRKSCVKSFSLGMVRDGDISTGLICGGRLTVFIDVIEPRPRLIVLGAGHIAKPLVEIASIVGFETVVVDDKSDFASRERFPSAGEIYVKSVDEFFNEFEFSGNDFIVIVYGDIYRDYEALKRALSLNLRYVGLIGSKRKIDSFKSKLISEGFSDVTFNILYAPIGIDINAETPEEIAVSIIAEVIKVYRSRGS